MGRFSLGHTSLHVSHMGMTAEQVALKPPVPPFRPYLPMRKAFLPLILLMAGCSFSPVVPAVDAPENLLPGSYSASTSDSDALPATNWWQAFGDPTLNALVDSALASNRDLRVAAGRLLEVQSQYRIARAAQLPAVVLGGDASRSDNPSNTGFSRNIGASVPNFPDRFTNESYTVSGTMAYELDLWGRVRADKRAALNTFFAAEADLAGVRLGIISQTISTYLELRALEAQLGLARENVSLLEERVELTEDRYERGLVATFELYAVRQEFGSTRTTVPLLEAALVEAQGRLALLLGTSASLDLTPESDLKLLLDSIPAGLPASLLAARPDVAGALFRVEAARQGVGSAKARLLPTLSLTATGGLQSAELSELLDLSQNFSNLVASLTAPLFQGGALRAGVDGAEARLDQAVAGYEQALLNAFREVQATLVGFEKQRERLDFLDEEYDFASESLLSTRARYRQGIGDYVALLDAERNLVRVKTARVTARRDLATARLAVHRALGGSWTQSDAS